MITKGEGALYVLSGEDAEKINRRRTNSESIAERIVKEGWPMGAQAHIGNPVKEGQTFPGIVVCEPADGPEVNLQVFLDGNDVYWAVAVFEDGGKRPAPGTWSRLN